MIQTNPDFCPAAGCRKVENNGPDSSGTISKFTELQAGSVVIIKHLQSRIEDLETEVFMSKHENSEATKHSERLDVPSPKRAKVLRDSCEVDVDCHELRAGTFVLVKHLQSKIRTLETELYALKCSQYNDSKTFLHEPECFVHAKTDTESVIYSTPDLFKYSVKETLIVQQPDGRGNVKPSEGECTASKMHQNQTNETCLHVDSQMDKPNSVGSKKAFKVARRPAHSPMDDRLNDHGPVPSGGENDVKPNTEYHESPNTDSQMDKSNIKAKGERNHRLACESEVEVDEDLSQKSTPDSHMGLAVNITNSNPHTEISNGSTIEFFCPNINTHSYQKPLGGGTKFSPQHPCDTTQSLVCRPGGLRIVHTQLMRKETVKHNSGEILADPQPLSCNHTFPSAASPGGRSCRDSTPIHSGCKMKHSLNELGSTPVHNHTCREGTHKSSNNGRKKLHELHDCSKTLKAVGRLPSMRPRRPGK